MWDLLLTLQRFGKYIAPNSMDMQVRKDDIATETMEKQQAKQGKRRIHP
ncbi:hypothetical protein [Dyadobacter arcticus]|uniref:Uncharacterized protein n=1 Tax=Dyadobacter arcticus TaxID=1078754 RepID=A0ABX0UMI1_9BACT|nr:hypothetical protein [Dyadobacter arcticus]NIJ52655.1 hypothetical protein [Dyadobacter arcticus]